MGGVAVTDRAPDWEARLAALLRVSQGRTYHARRWNCALFAHTAAEAVSGRALPYTWKGTLAASADAALPRVAPALARRGDVVLADAPEPSLGVCVGRAAVFVGLRGLHALPMRAVRVAWRV